MQVYGSVMHLFDELWENHVDVDWFWLPPFSPILTSQMLKAALARQMLGRSHSSWSLPAMFFTRADSHCIAQSFAHVPCWPKVAQSFSLQRCVYFHVVSLPEACQHGSSCPGEGKTAHLVSLHMLAKGLTSPVFQGAQSDGLSTV